VLPLVVFVAGFVGVAALLCRKRPFVPTLIVIPVILFLITGSEKYPGGPLTGACYGGAFLPFSAVAACCGWYFLRRWKAREDTLPASSTEAAPGLVPLAGGEASSAGAT
jgi:membrane protein implicated in regulation of membrane protease activity